MLKELFQAVNEQAVKARQSELLLETVTEKTLLINGTVTKIPKPPGIRVHGVLTLDDIVAAANQWGKSGVLWHNPEAVTLVCDDSDRREMVKLVLEQSEQFTTLQNLGKPLSQAEFSRLLRYRLNDCVTDSLIATISKLNFVSGGSQASEIAAGRERGTREFMVDLAGENKPPEIVDVALSVYSTAGLRVRRTIRCGLDYTLPPANVEFRFMPLPDEITIAIQNAQAELHQVLVKAVKIPVYSGTP